MDTVMADVRWALIRAEPARRLADRLTQSEPAQLQIQRGSGDAQQLGGAGFVAGGVRQRLCDGVVVRYQRLRTSMKWSQS
jgi:hypothetical protein